MLIDVVYSPVKIQNDVESPPFVDNGPAFFQGNRGFSTFTLVYPRKFLTNGDFTLGMLNICQSEDFDLADQKRTRVSLRSHFF
jgi:hypothetical protein